MESLEHQHKTHIANLDTALKIIAQVGVVYNSLERSDQKELLRHMVERVVIDPVGKIRLELRAPFAYLRDISRQVRGRASSSEGNNKAKTGSICTGSSSERCSDSFLLCWGGRIRTFEWQIQSLLPYRLATPQNVRLIITKVSLQTSGKNRPYYSMMAGNGLLCLHATAESLEAVAVDCIPQCPGRFARVFAEDNAARRIDN